MTVAIGHRRVTAGWEDGGGDGKNAASANSVSRSQRNSCEQIHTYEAAANRVSPPRLYRFAALLNVPVAYFFEACMRAYAHRTVARR
jgi:hypothetical protein